MRERIAKVIANQLLAQDGERMRDDPFAGNDSKLTWPYLDQGEVDFGAIADAVLAEVGRQDGASAAAASTIDVR